MENSTKEHIFYIDVLRVLATIAVVFYHCNTGQNEKLHDVIKIILNWCVPVFLMISGNLFLNFSSVLTIEKMFFKIMPRIIGIIGIWGYVYNLLSLFIIKGVSLNIIFEAAKMVVQGDTTYCYQFWYLYYLIGIYSLLPIIKPWVDKNMVGDKPTREVIITFIFILCVSIIIPSLRSILGFSSTYWNNAFTMYSGLSFYVLSGSFLGKWYMNSITRKCIFYTWLAQLVFLLINVCIGRSEYILRWYGYASFFTWEMSFLLFDTVHRINYDKWTHYACRTIQNCSKSSLGIYIFHVMILWAMTKVPFVNNWKFQLFNMFFVVIVTIIICIFMEKNIRKIPVLKKLI